ncbi:unknown protein [Seminavis robusta]|uniref:Uncharacterized protein n=1 Tax=Seminavis robusta TaxID=568900 RepID=A0A9N8F320_9STRA|nr:unknown protein [Seminavis robusta]|eukprot:Sro3230_g345650.1 n/a (264) ;mRNA; r:2599-3540
MMRAAGAYDDWMCDRYAEHMEREEKEAKALDNRNFAMGSNIIWKSIQMNRNMESFLRNERGVPQEVFDWLADGFGGLTSRHFFNIWLKAQICLVKRRYTDENEPMFIGPQNVAFTNKDVIFVMFNKIISNRPLMVDFCAANHACGGCWRFWPLVHRFMSCFGVQPLGQGDWLTFKEYKAHYAEQIANSPPSPYELEGTPEYVAGEEDGAQDAVQAIDEGEIAMAYAEEAVQNADNDGGNSNGGRGNANDAVVVEPNGNDATNI